MLEPVRPLVNQQQSFDPYNYEDQPMVEDYYYGDYYDDLPDFSALKGSAPTKKPLLVEPDQPPMPEMKTNMARQPTEAPPKMPNLNNPFKEKRTPSRQELLLKMSEEKQREQLQKERAKLLEETLLSHQKPPKPTKNPTRNRIPIRKRKLNNNNEAKPPSQTPFQVKSGFFQGFS